jgi:L-asparaginase
MSNPLIHIFYTGGTIGMIRNSENRWVLDPEFATKLRNQYLRGHNVPEWDIEVRNPTLDSSNMSPEDWLSIAKYIQDKEREDPHAYTGYVVLHGTDTMAYTVSALTFMIEELTKPIIFTGSQVPMSQPGNDALPNVVQSLNCAAAERILPQVYLYFFDRLMLGCRTVKIHTDDRNGFDTPNLDAVATVVDEEMVFSENISGLSGVKAANSLTIQEFTETQVGVLRLFPGLSKPIAENFLDMDGLKGAILHAYGAGNGPASLGDVFTEAARTKILVACTQCLRGSVDFTYETGLGQYGVVSGHDMTLEAATTKLFWLLSKYPDDPGRIKSEMQRDIKGELTVRPGITS